MSLCGCNVEDLLNRLFPKRVYSNMFFYINLQIPHIQQNYNDLTFPYTLSYTPISILILILYIYPVLYHPIILFLFQTSIKIYHLGDNTTEFQTPDTGLTNFYRNSQPPNASGTLNVRFTNNWKQAWAVKPYKVSPPADKQHRNLKYTS